MAEFLTDDANIKRAIGGTLKNGVATISLESKSLLGDAGINKISDTIYFDAQNKKYINDITVNLKDQDIAGRFFVDKNGILISSEDVLNNKNTYGIYPETLAQKFKTSTIASTIFAGQNHDEIQDMLNKFKEAYKEVFEKLKSLGLEPEEREFVPHITLARKFKPGENFPFEETGKLLPEKAVFANRISLMKSERIEGVLRYTEIYSRKLL